MNTYEPPCVPVCNICFTEIPDMKKAFSRWDYYFCTLDCVKKQNEIEQKKIEEKEKAKPNVRIGSSHPDCGGGAY